MKILKYFRSERSKKGRISNKGFSLIELMVVIAILGAITAIALPMYNKYRAKSYQTKAVTELKEYMKAFRAAYAAGEPNFRITNQTHNVGTGVTYNTVTYQGSDFNTTCNLRVVSSITLGEPGFNLSVIPNNTVCYDLYSNNANLTAFNNMVQNYQ